MIKRACEVFEEASETSDADIKEAALHNVASLYMMRDDYDSALKAAERLNPKVNDTMLLLATIYCNKGENDNAKKLYQRILFKNIQTCILVLQGLSRVAEKESNIKDAQFFLETIISLNTLFKFEDHGEYSALQLAELYAQNNDRDKAIVMLNRYIIL